MKEVRTIHRQCIWFPQETYEKYDKHARDGEDFSSFIRRCVIERYSRRKKRARK